MNLINSFISDFWSKIITNYKFSFSLIENFYLHDFREPIKCGDIVRLEHLSTKKNLHSHHESSPLSGKQEVSAYGDKRGDGDTGDHWKVICKTDFWERNNSIMFKHVDTES